MMDWNTLRMILAVAREGSVRAAAKSLGVDQATLSRRIARLERTLGARLFDRLPAGLSLTPAGNRMIEAAERMEEAAAEGRRHIEGQDTSLSGTLRVTAADVTLAKFLMPMFVNFAARHPQIDLEIMSSYEFFSLARREADVAIRITSRVPDGLVGESLAKMAFAVYGSTNLIEHYDGKIDITQVPWVGWHAEELNAHHNLKPFPVGRIRYRINSALVEIEAVRAGLGIGSLACYHSDADPTLRRVVPEALVEPGNNMWILTHRDLRHTARVQTFMRFMREAVAEHRDRIEGRRPFLAE